MIKIGMIGTGHGLRTLKPGFEHTGLARIVAVSGSSHERASQLAQEYGIEFACSSAEELCSLTELDLICVASPNSYHLEHATVALKSGRHVYLEKPIAMSDAEATKVLSIVQGQGSTKQVFVGHQLRFNPFVREMVKFKESGSLGRIYSLTITQRGGAFSSKDRPWTWEFEVEKGGGVRLAMATHLLDLSNFVIGTTAKQVSLSADPVHAIRTPEGGESRKVRVSNFCSMDVDYGDAFAQLSTSAAAHVPGQFEIEILGSDGAMKYDGVTDLKLFQNGAPQEIPGLNNLVADYSERPGSSVFRKSFTYFAQAVLDSISGAKPEAKGAHTVHDAVDLMRVLDEAYDGFQSRVPNRNEAF